MGRQTSPDDRPQIADPRRLFPWAHGLRQAAQAQVGGSGRRPAAQQTSKAVRSYDGLVENPACARDQLAPGACPQCDPCRPNRPGPWRATTSGAVATGRAAGSPSLSCEGCDAHRPGSTAASAPARRPGPQTVRQAPSRPGNASSSTPDRCRRRRSLEAIRWAAARPHHGSDCDPETRPPTPTTLGIRTTEAIVGLAHEVFPLMGLQRLLVGHAVVRAGRR